jgi:hypothetical protein
MIPKSGYRFSDKIMRQGEVRKSVAFGDLSGYGGAR